MISLVLFVVVEVYNLSTVFPRDIKHMQIKRGDQERPDPPPPPIKFKFVKIYTVKLPKMCPRPPTPPL